MNVLVLSSKTIFHILYLIRPIFLLILSEENHVINSFIIYSCYFH